MATFAPDQIPSGSYDSSAVSIVVADRIASDSRSGSFFTSDFAAVSPVYFHPLESGKVFGVFSQRWYGASRPSGEDPNLFSAYSVDTEPSWAIFDGSNGHHYLIPGQYGTTPPTAKTYDSRVLVGACSRTNSYLYLMQRATASGENFGVISHYHIHPITWQVVLIGEDVIPSVTVGSETVVFDVGVKYNPIYLIFVGRDSQGKLYFARKNWGHIGRPADFEYQSDKGWSTDFSRLTPLRSAEGDLVSAGPVSFATYRDQSFMSVVSSDGGVMSAQIYVSKGLWDAWVPLNLPYALGTQGSSYLGGTVYLQPALRSNTGMVGDSSAAGIPLVYAKKNISGSNSSISIYWDLWPITANTSRDLSSGASLAVTTKTITT